MTERISDLDFQEGALKLLIRLNSFNPTSLLIYS